MILTTEEGRHRSTKTDRETRVEFAAIWNALSQSERSLARELIEEIQFVMTEQSLGFEDLDEVLNLSGLYHSLVNDHYVDQIVGVEEFVKNPYYLGEIGKKLFPKWLDDLKELFEGGHYFEAIATGSLGCGKSTWAEIATIYMFYELCMLKDPASTYGLMSGSEIILICYNRDQELARDVTYGGVKSKIEMSPFFEDIGVKIGNSSLILPSKNLKIIAASAKSAKALGRNVFGGIIDEADFLEGVSIGGKMRGTTSGEIPFVEQLHSSIIQRMKSRFDRGGILPGKLIMASSAKNKDAFTNRRIGEAAGESSVFCRDYALYEILPAERFLKDRFWVLVGNERIRHKILTDEEYEQLGEEGRDRLREQDCKFLHVPMNFLSDFKRNIEDAIRDVGGVVTVSLSPYIQVRQRIYEAVDPNLSHPMPQDVWVTGTTPNIYWSQLCRSYRRRIGVGQWEEGIEPRRHPDAARHAHIDLSLGKTDAAGLCISHIVDYMKVERRNVDQKLIEEEAPIIEVDLLLRIEAAPGDEIDIGSVRSIIYLFMDHGYSFGFASMDSWNSAESLQKFRQQGMKADIVSVDATTEPYDFFKMALYEGRIVYYNYPILLKELEDLQRDMRGAKPKVDHLPGGSKDVADGLAGTTFTLSTQPRHRGSIELGISNYERRDDPDAWVRETMQRAGDKSVEKVGDVPDRGGPIIFTG